MGFENKTKLRKAKEKRTEKLLKTREFTMLPLSQIVIPENRGIDSDSKMDEITEELLEHGLLSPVSVAGPYEDGTYKVIEGARRIKSLRTFIKKSEIPCYIVAEAVSDREMQLLALGANRVHREDDVSLNIKYAQIIFDDCVDGKIEELHAPAALSKITGLTVKQSRKYMRITREGTDVVQKAVSDGKLPINLAQEIVKAAPDDEAQQNRMVEALEDRNHGTQNAYIKAVKNGEFSSRSEKALRSHADYIEAEAARKKVCSIETKQIRKAEEALTYLLDLEERPAPASMYKLAGLCREVCDYYGFSTQEKGA